MNYKRKLFAVHSYTGLIAGIFILTICLSGCFVALLQQYENTFEADKLLVSTQSQQVGYDSLFAVAKRQVPNFQLYDYGRFPQNKNEAFEILYFPDGTYHSAFINPYNATVTGYIDNNLSKWILKFHWSFAIGKQGIAGSIILFVFALCVLLSVITGFIIYKKHIIDGLLFRIKISAKNKYSGLHRIIGVWTMLFMFILFGTGAYINYHIMTGEYSYPGGQILQQQPKFLLNVSVDTMLAYIKKEQPNFIPKGISFPQLTGGHISINGNFKGDNDWTNGSSTFDFDEYTGRFIAFNNRQNISNADIADNTLNNLHYASYGGLWLKIIYSIFALLSACMPITGFFLWRKRKFNYFICRHSCRN